MNNYKINKKLALLLLLFICFNIDLHSQSKLKTTITANHKLISGSKIFIVPPADFRLHFNSTGYVNNETGANFSVIQTSKSINTIKQHLSKTYLINKKYKIIEIKKYKINKLKAYWYELESEFFDRITTKYILIIGNKKEHAMIEAYCPIEYPLANIALRKSIFSVFYDIDSSAINK